MNDEEPVIKVEGISKSYHISHQTKPGYGTVKDSFSNLIKKPLLGKKAGGREIDETFWALKDINFEVKKGEVFGIVGKNGSGKSTLLKILSRIVDPTTGIIRMHGRVASMLEVGTGFHPELTGRENIYFNGSMIGMSRQEIKSKFDEIVAFSEIEKFLDTPVKFYSSGMYVRLAFSVAAHLDPDVLIIDEVLAVGDAQFQKKCLDRILSGAKRGQTILFVSHSMTIVKQVCNRAMYLEKGRAKYIGETEFVTEEYLANNRVVSESSFEKEESHTTTKKKADILKIELQNMEGKKLHAIDMYEPWQLYVKYKIHEPLKKTFIGLQILTGDEQTVYLTTDADTRKHLPTKEPGIYEATVSLKGIDLPPGTYYLKVTIQEPSKNLYDSHEGLPLRIRLDPEDIRNTYFDGRHFGYYANKIEWHTKREEN